ncbi:hypothetical protein HAX54_001974, partial [Datura stramonium]|nr:hypothetical protein [Datura stramonium]
ESDLDEERRVTQLRFVLEGMEAHYLSFQKKRTIIEEARFDVDSFKVDFPNTKKQF